MGLVQEEVGFAGKSMLSLLQSPWFVILMIFIITIVVAGIITLMIGLLGLIGLFCVLISFYILYLQKGKIRLSLKNPFLLLFAVGLLLLIGSQYGLLEVYQIDLSVIPGFTELHAMANQ